MSGFFVQFFCVNIPQIIYSSATGHLDDVQFGSTVNSAAIIPLTNLVNTCGMEYTGVRYTSLWFTPKSRVSGLPDIYTFSFGRDDHIATISAGDFRLLHILANTWYLLAFSFSPF